jgi:hypothetical protein
MAGRGWDQPIHRRRDRAAHRDRDQGIHPRARAARRHADRVRPDPGHPAWHRRHRPGVRGSVGMMAALQGATVSAAPISEATGRLNTVPTASTKSPRSSSPRSAWCSPPGRSLHRGAQMRTDASRPSSTCLPPWTSSHEDCSSTPRPIQIGPLPTSYSNAAAYRTNQHPLARSS